jgi:hypothetical protein
VLAVTQLVTTSKDRRSRQGGHTSCIDWPKTRTMLCFATIWGLRRSTAARVKWNSDKLRIIAAAEIIAMFAAGVDVVKCVGNRDFGVKRDRSRLHVDVACHPRTKQSKLRNFRDRQDVCT